MSSDKDKNLGRSRPNADPSYRSAAPSNKGSYRSNSQNAINRGGRYKVSPSSKANITRTLSQRKAIRKKIAARKYARFNRTLSKEQALSKDLIRTKAKNAVIRDKRLKVSTGITSVTNAVEKVVSDKQGSPIEGDSYGSSLSKIYHAPTNTLNTVNAVKSASESLNEAVLSQKQRKAFKEEYIEKMIKDNRLKEGERLTRAQRSEISRALNQRSKYIRTQSSDVVKRYKDLKKNSIREKQKSLAKKRAIENIQKKKAAAIAKKAAKKVGKNAAKGIVGKFVAAAAAAVGATILPIVVVILVVVLLVNILFNFFMVPEYNGLYADEIPVFTNVYDAITNLSQLYARDVRSYCLYNNVPMPDDCTPAWGQVMALFTVLSQFNGDAARDIIHDSSELEYVPYYNGSSWINGSLQVRESTGAFAMSSVTGEGIDAEVILNSGHPELFYFCFRIVHYDMIGVECTEENGYAFDRSEEFGASVNRSSWRFQRGLPRMQTVELDPIVVDRPISQTETGTFDGNFRYADENLYYDNADCPYCNAQAPDSSLSGDAYQDAYNRYRSAITHLHTHEQIWNLNVSNSAIKTWTNPLTASEALYLIHNISKGSNVTVNGTSYPSSTRIQQYCERLMVKDFEGGRFIAPSGVGMVGAMHCLQNGVPNGGCGTCVREHTQGCMYEWYQEVLQYIWGPDDVFYYYPSGDTFVASRDPHDTSQATIHNTGALPNLGDIYYDGGSYYAPVLRITDPEIQNTIIFQICQAIYMSEQGGVIREVWVEHLRYMAAMCASSGRGYLWSSSGAYSPSTLNLNMNRYLNNAISDMDSSGNIYGWLTPDTFVDGTIQNAYTNTDQYGQVILGQNLVTKWNDVEYWWGNILGREYSTYYIPEAFGPLMVSEYLTTTTYGSSDYRYDWLTPYYEAPRMDTNASVLYNYSSAWCAWFVMYMANTCGTVQAICDEGSFEYQSYYNLLSHTPNDVDEGTGYFLNDAACSTACQYMLDAFYQDSMNEGNCRVVLGTWEGIQPGDIVFSRGSGNDYRRVGISPPVGKINHVQVCIGITDDGQVICIGGNENDRVQVDSYSMSGDHCLAYVDLFGCSVITNSSVEVVDGTSDA